MRRQKNVTIRDKEITANEITALESQEYMERMADDEDSFIDELFPDRIPASLVKLCTGLTEEELLSFYPSEIEEIINAVEEINPTTASRIMKLAEIGKIALEKHPELIEKIQEKDSKKTAAD